MQQVFSLSKFQLQARHPQFVHVQYIKALRMHSKTGEVVVETHFLGGRGEKRITPEDRARFPSWSNRRS